MSECHSSMFQTMVIITYEKTKIGLVSILRRVGRSKGFFFFFFFFLILNFSYINIVLITPFHGMVVFHDQIYQSGMLQTILLEYI